MPRLQVLWLPAQPDEPTPFALIVDQVTSPPDEQTGEERLTGWQGFGEQIGARGVLITDETIELPEAAEAAEEPRAQVGLHISLPEQPDHEDVVRRLRTVVQAFDRRSW